MGLILEDGKGRGYSVSVSEVNRLNVSSKTNPRSFYVSRDDGRAFNISSVDADAVAGDLICYVKNTSTSRNLFIKQLHFSALNAVLWKTWVVTGTAAGTAIVPANLNLTSGKSAEALAFGSAAITGLSTGALIGSHRSVAAAHSIEAWENVLILGPNNALAIEYDTGITGPAEVNIEFHYESINRDN